MNDLRTEVVRIAALGRDIELNEITGRGLIAYMEAAREEDSILAGATLCKHCVNEFRELSVDDILDTKPAAAIVEIAHSIMKVFGVDEAKNSESAPNDYSSTD